MFSLEHGVWAKKPFKINGQILLIMLEVPRVKLPLTVVTSYFILVYYFRIVLLSVIVARTSQKAMKELTRRWKQRRNISFALSVLAFPASWLTAPLVRWKLN